MALGRPEIGSKNSSSEATKSSKRFLTHSVGAKDPPTPAKIDGERAAAAPVAQLTDFPSQPTCPQNSLNVHI